MNKRNLAIIIAASVGLALVLGAVIFIVTQQSEAEQDKEPYRFEESEHMGVAQLLSKSDIEQAIDGIGSDVSGPEASGTLYLDDIRSETATYGFTADGQEVKLDVEVKIYPESAESDGRLSPETVFRATEGEEIEGVGSMARMYFPVDNVTSGAREYSLIALEGRKVIVMQITMPASAEIALSRAAVQQILQELGSKVNLEDIN